MGRPKTEKIVEATLTALLAVLCSFSFWGNVAAQNRCYTPQEAQTLIEAIKNKQIAAWDMKLRRELIEMREEREKLNTKITSDFEKNKALIPRANQLGETHLARVCRMIKASGWPEKDALQNDGFDAFTYLISNSKAFDLQRELLPVLIQAAKSEYIGFPFVASMVDSIRLQAGLPQIFGTQATIKNDIVYIYPLLNEEKVDEWRKEYQLPSLAAQIRRLEAQYMMPVLKSQRRSSPPAAQSDDTSSLGISADENEPVKVVTKVVNLNVRVLQQTAAKQGTSFDLSKNDFQIFEDGVEQEVSFFHTTEEPFDLILVLDFSGSTLEKRGLIKKAAQRFVEFSRPKDRIAIVAFATEIQLITALTTDKTALKIGIDGIKLEGGSPIWDTLRFTYESIVKKESVGRRSAIVIMTDGLDNSRATTFADVMETVRRGDTTIFPIYLNTSMGGGIFERFGKRSQDMLSMLADETGGQMYAAKGINDLNGIYEQIVNDLGKVYTVGYEPKDERRDGGWRELSVKIKSQPSLVVKTRRGYYAN
jgi:Ca-activated chloride channel family protein